ncbi:MAG: hypothetical protein FWD06_02105 [Oscillospiraceae bacterium]|nr:hypothetical protein [Oscillospiraceae bacterium]
MKRCFSAILAIAMLAALAVGAVGFTRAALQSGSWQQAEVRWQGFPNDWEIVELQGQAIVEQTQQFFWQILTLRAAPGEMAHIRITVTGETIYLWLFCDEELQAALSQAQSVLQHPTRHHAGYITQLRNAVAQAQSFYASAEICPEEFTQTIEQLQRLAANPQTVIVSNGLLGRFAPAWWNLLDSVTEPLRRMSRVEVMLPLLGRVVSAVFSRER